MATCQFCGASLATVARPQTVQKKKAGPEQWVMTLYYIVASYWMLNGLWDIGSSIYSFTGSDSAGHGPGPFTIIAMIIGAISFAVGLGLVLKWDLARGVANIFCWIIIANAALSFLSMAGLGALFGTGFMLFAIFMSVLQIAAAGTQIWLLSETEYMN